MAWTPAVEAAKQALIAELAAYAITTPLGDIKPFAADKTPPIVDALISVVTVSVQEQIRSSTTHLREEVRSSTAAVAGPLALAFVGIAAGIGAAISAGTTK